MRDKQNSKERVNRKNTGKWRSALGAFIPRYVPNRMVAGGMSLLGILHRTRRSKAEANREHNLEVLTAGNVAAVSCGNRLSGVGKAAENVIFMADAYVENQPRWKDVRFGNRSTMSYSGCEILAVSNALLALGKSISGRALVELISHFEKHGAVWAGRLGVTPLAIRRYFRKAGYEVNMLYCRREEAVNALGMKSDTVIAMVYNDARDIFKMIHTVNISKDETGKYHAHNCYKVNSKKEFISDGPFETLWDAIHRMGRGKSALVCVIGIVKKRESDAG